MRYLEDITEAKLKAGWKYTFDNKHIINLGNNIPYTEITVNTKPFDNGFHSHFDRSNGSVNRTKKHVNFDSMIEWLTMKSRLYDLELRSMNLKVRR